MQDKVLDFIVIFRQSIVFFLFNDENCWIQIESLKTAEAARSQVRIRYLSQKNNKDKQSKCVYHFKILSLNRKE